LHTDIKAGDVKNFEHYLGHPFSVLLWVERRFGHQDGVLFWRNSEFVVEGVVPDLLHIVPVGHNAMLDGLLDAEHATFLLGLATYVDFLLIKTYHDTRDLRSPDNSTEDGSWRVVTPETCFAHT
jgi:hypothetical protein